MVETETIIFDDAGGGNLFGGLVIGALHRGAYESRVIDSDLFAFGDCIHSIISSTVLQMTRDAGSPRTVILCRGNVFDAAARDLERLGFSVRRECIVGSLQHQIEEDFIHHLISLGLPEYIRQLAPRDAERKHESYRYLNEFCASYVLAHPTLRIDRVKSNTSLYHELRTAEIKREYVAKLRGRKRRCVECGERVTEDVYRCEGAGRVFYVHRDCAQWEE